MADLSTTIAGLKMRTPFGVSSMSALNWWYPAGPMQKWVDWHKRCVDAGAGFVYLPSVFPAMRDEEPVRKNHLSNYFPIGNDGFLLSCAANGVQIAREPCRRLTEALKKALPAEIPIVSSLVNPTGDPETYIELAKEMESDGADVLEINGGCPSELMDKPGGKPEAGAKYGEFLGTSVSAFKEIVKVTVGSVKIPVGVKMTPQAGFPGMMVAAEAVINAGAKYILTAHMPLAFGPFDIWNGGKPLYPLLKHVEANPVSVYGGGETIRIINHYYTASTAMFFPSVDVWSGGGIVTGQHLVESIMLGAKAGQAAGGVMLHGISQIKRIVKFLEKYMGQCGYKTIEDFRGLALNYVKPFDDALVNESGSIAIAAQVDESKCIGCRTCADSICPAISMEADVAQVNQDDCCACGLCLVICPQGAISMVPSKQTLGERITMGKDYTNLS